LPVWVVAVPDYLSQASPLCVLEENIVFIKAMDLHQGVWSRPGERWIIPPLFSE